MVCAALPLVSGAHVCESSPDVCDEQANLLDLDLAWARVKLDVADGLIFIRRPHEIHLIEEDYEGWSGALREDVRADRYHPGPQTIVDVPKPRGAVRPGSQLSLRDAVVYYAAVGACMPTIEPSLRWAGEIDFSHQLATDTGRQKWITNQYNGWTQFRERSLAKIDEGFSYVVTADIAAFYENVDVGTLMSDLRGVGCPTPALSIVGDCLNKWVQVPGRGVPQGYSASDILAKLYLDSVDHNIAELGYEHFRYVDDIRIFCRTLPDARRALVDVSQLLRRRGLQLASEKLEIHRADQARAFIAGVVTMIQTVQKSLISELVTTLELGNPYLEVWEVDELLAANPDEAPLDLIHETYQSHFIDAVGPFNKTLFRYLLKRLGSAKDRLAVENCTLQFERRPEETRAILRYVAAVDAVNDFSDFLAAFLESDRCVYAYQAYQVLQWYLDIDREPPTTILSTARQVAFDPARPGYLRSVARELLGQWGTQPDLERLQATYDETPGDSEKAEIICALRRMERARRNSFLARAEGDGELQRRAARLVRAEGL
jgi:hypothetical protein